MKKLISCFIGLVFLTGCFFSYDSSAELAQGKIVKIYVSPVVNETNQYGIEGDITRAIADEITNDGRLSFVNT
ncbi:MAG: hypothetical protein LBV66_01450, partial [Elusimicrobiota bacterium]|nr:hypothetical protein [Elusimicrobiota bacterium]